MNLFQSTHFILKVTLNIDKAEVYFRLICASSAQQWWEFSKDATTMAAMSFLPDYYGWGYYSMFALVNLC